MENIGRHLAITILATLLTIGGVLMVHRQYVAPSFQPVLVTESDAKTKPVMPAKPASLPQNNSRDSDRDGLTNDLERLYGTDVNNPDTDGDGYPDGLEVANHYNPRGLGRMATYGATSEKSEPTARAADMFYVDSLKIAAPLIYVDKVSESSFQAGLSSGVVHYPGTALLGEWGNVFIFGHSSDYSWSRGNYKTVFAPLPKIQIGTDIIVTDSNARPYIYKVYSAFVAAANDTKYLDQYGFKRKLLTVQTSYPVGTAKQRFIVLAELVE